MKRDTASEVQTLVECGAIPQAIATAREALPLLAGPERGPVLLAMAAACNIGGQYVEALRAGVAASESFTAAGSHTGVCDALVRIAQSLRSAGDYASAIATLEQAEDIARTLDEPLRLAQVLRNVGVCSSLVGRHQHALSCLQEALDVLLRVGSLTEQFATRLSLYNARNRKAESLPADAAERGELLRLDEWQSLVEDCRAASHHRLEVLARGNHAITLHQRGHHLEAIAELAELLPAYRVQGLRPNEGLCFAELGRCHQALGETAAARESYRQAIDILEDGGTLDDLQSALEGLSEVEEALGDHAAALAALRRVRAIDKRKSDEAARSALVQRELRIELARLTSQWAEQATRDPLTGLGNRRALDRWMEEHLARVEHGEPLSLLLMDLDHFKRINDHFGHGTGDEVLRRVAKVIQECCRHRDLAVRYGGEEFVLALSGVDHGSATAVAQRLLESVASQPWAEVAAELAVTVSIGLAEARETLDAPSLLTLADRRLYAAKYAGRNQVVVAG
ncbi:MAG TPA: tetratricopeptide repeat-containing diguanylate cyclase [Albitalea sp.]|uniref:tetratricopeptide repeat-containing diguanylate cyclase n=1 Tax=Piscinibacter sp. TaxID=1903157 RepID=UPI002ED5A737